MGNDRRTLVGIQYLRAIAALMVAYFHLRGQIPAYTPGLTAIPGVDTDRLGAGVDIFFVISGFIMMVTSGRITPGSFFVRRLIRVAPPYWILTAVLAVTAVWLPQLFRTTSLTPEYFVKSILFVPYVNPGQSGSVVPLLVPGWSLNLEMFFYIFFALVLFLPAAARLLTMGVLFSALALIGSFLCTDSLHPVFCFYARPIIMEFWLGMAVAHFFLKEQLRVPPTLAIAVLLGSFIALVTTAHLPGNTALTTALESLLIVLSVAALELQSKIPYWGWLVLLGDASYSIYLTHIFTLGLMRSVWQHLGGGVAEFAVSSMIMVVAVALLTHRYIEMPVHRWLQERLGRPANRQTGARMA